MDPAGEAMPGGAYRFVVDLVRHAVDALATVQRAVSLASIATTPEAIDPTGRGTSTTSCSPGNSGPSQPGQTVIS